MSHKHKWVTQFYSFDPIEHDEPYEVQYCGDRECGQRRTVTMSESLVEEVREFNDLPSEDIQGGEE
jgi:hypothetical protein